MGKGNSIVNPLGHNFLGTGGTGLNRPLSAFSTGGISEFAQRNPFGVPINNPLANAFGNGDHPSSSGISGPFSLDPAQFEGDRAAISDLGKRQFDDTTGFINQDQTDRATARQKLADALTQQAASSFKLNLPGIEEDLNARHLLNGSGLGQEIGRQQGQIASDIVNQVGIQGAQDIDLASQQRSSALTGRQGFETGALQRGLSLEDFINQANVAKSIGAQMAPQVSNGKGTAVAGLGAGAAAGAPFGPWGSAIGGGLGALVGNNRSGK